VNEEALECQKRLERSFKVNEDLQNEISENRARLAERERQLHHMRQQQQQPQQPRQDKKKR